MKILWSSGYLSFSDELILLEFNSENRTVNAEKKGLGVLINQHKQKIFYDLFLKGSKNSIREVKT